MCFFLDQYGCAKNQVDGELIMQHLRNDGWVLCETPDDADIIIINSCGFIEAAKKESLDAVINARKAYPNAKILLAGCLAERYGVELHTELVEADGIFGNGDLSLVTQAAKEAVEGSRPFITAEQQGVCAGEREHLLSFAGSAYVKITEGCSNRCSFCAIPLIRGNLRSRSISDITAEIETLVQRGIFEINLIGQDLASFGTEISTDTSVTDCAADKKTASPLSRLLSSISTLSGTFWIRLLYMHPDNFPEDILPVIAADERILPYFDIPFQSGSDRIIAAMNRRNTAVHYIELVSKIRKLLPLAVLRTTFLVGFPEETEEQFEQTQKFLEAIRPDWSGCFMYSSEEGTPASLLKKQVAKRIAVERKKKLEEVQSHITCENMHSRVGEVLDVLIEEHVSGYVLGRAWFQAPEVDGAVVICCDDEQISLLTCGKVVAVRITGCSGIDLEGIPLIGFNLVV